MIRFADVWKLYGRMVALRAFTLEVGTGTATVLRGANGSGKSTALKLAAGIALPDRGTVRRRPGRVGYVGHRSQLLPSVSVRDNLLYQLNLYGRRRADLTPWVKRFGVDRYWHRTPGVLSRGMLQRVCLVRAFAVAPELMLLDEPETGLDVEGRETLRAVLSEVLEGDVTILIATHTDSFAGLPGVAEIQLEDVARS